MNKQACIYIVEDDPTILQTLKHHLSQHYRVVTVNNYRAILQEIDEVQPDLILMDITLPYFNGFYWTTEIRKTRTLPIIFISSADDEMNAVMAMNMGGDDYLTKPFSLTILDAKIAAFLRRVQEFSSPSNQFQLDQFVFDKTGFFSNGSDRVHLTPTETRILNILFSQRNQIVSKESILDQLWEGEDFIDQNTLSVNMTRLRKKLQGLDFDRIYTVRGVGYVLR
ncbi:response regulator transcription factor [Streptococcus caprae]|uniref:Response regulator transcription factor n=1 Tax=Streptococcus caprae TaxID=1640501 RepID=A0ABV8CXM9_9STRE